MEYYIYIKKLLGNHLIFFCFPSPNPEWEGLVDR